MENPVAWALGAAITGTLVTLSVSIFLWGVPRSFVAFFLRSTAVTGLTLMLIFGVAFRRLDTDS